MTVKYFSAPAEFRLWLTARHQKSRELWVGFFKKASRKPSITYAEALDEALCFGWIDGVRRSVTADAYAIRFTPRKPKSQWSAVNIRHFERLSKAGRIHASGRKAFEGAKKQARTYSYEQRNEARFGKEAEAQFRANRKAWEFFQSQPPWYRRTATFWVVSAKKDKTREKRLSTLIEDSASGRPIKPLTRHPSQNGKN